MAARDFYDILGVSRTATQQEIQRSYRKLARQYHPDINREPGSDERFKDVSEAYDVLSDPDLRRRYDAFGEDFRRVPPDVSPEEFARAQQGARARAGGGQEPGRGWQTGPEGQRVFYGTGGVEDVDLEDLLGSMFGAGTTGGRRRGGFGPTPGPDQEAELPLSVEQAYAGGKTSLSLPRSDGPRTFTVDVPPGVTEGQRIRLAGQGGQGSRGAPPGDLYLLVRLAPHPRYRLDGRDITVDLPVAPWEAALGAHVPVDTPGGEAKVRVPPGTSSGRRLRLRGRGMPNAKGAPGDLYAQVKIRVPETLDDAERRLFSELASASGFDPRRSS